MIIFFPDDPAGDAQEGEGTWGCWEEEEGLMEQPWDDR